MRRYIAAKSIYVHTSYSLSMESENDGRTVIAERGDSEVSAKHCNHVWDYEGDPRAEIFIGSQTLQFPVVCTKCGKEANEVWHSFIYTDASTNELVE